MREFLIFFTQTEGHSSYQSQFTWARNYLKRILFLVPKETRLLDDTQRPGVSNFIILFSVLNSMVKELMIKKPLILFIPKM